MQNLEKRKIPKRPHASMFVKGSSEFGGIKYDTLHDIAKYAPKYRESIGLNVIRPRFINALKRIKRAYKTNQDQSQTSRMNQWRLLMQNKFKTVLKIERECSREKWTLMNKVFPNIRCRLFEDRSFWYSDFQKDGLYLKLVKRFFRFLPGMVRLKDLSLTIRPVNHFALLKKLNSMTHILNSLQTLQIKSSVVRDFQETSLLPALLENENLLKRLTSLCIGKVTDEKSAEIFKALPKHCDNLVHLKFEIPPKGSTSNLSSSNPPVNLVHEILHYQFNTRPQESPSLLLSSSPHANYLQSLEDFERLEKIEINVKDPEIFIANFRGPQSLKYASFVFEHGSWDEISQELGSLDKEKLSKDHPIEESTEGNQRLYRFFKRWNRLDSLVSLEISTSYQPRAEVIKIFNFMTFLLSSLSSLELGNFTLKSTYSPFDTDNVSIDFGKILSALQSVSSKLKSLSFIPPGSCLTIYQPEKESLNFSQLTSLSLHLNVSELNSIQNILNLFERSCSKESTIELKLPSVEIWTNQALLDFLRILSGLSRNLTTSFVLWIENLDLENFDSIFEPWIQRDSGFKGVSLEIQICENFNRNSSKAFAILSKIFKGLKKDDEEFDTGVYFLENTLKAVDECVYI